MDGISSSDDGDDGITPPVSPAMVLSHPVPRASINRDNQNTRLRFKCPASFTEHPVTDGSMLHMEDIDDNKELWLIRVPNNFDSDISGHIDLDLRRKAAFTRGDKNYLAIPTVLGHSRLKDDTRVWLPDREGKVLPAPPFHGHMTVIEMPSLPTVTLPPSPPSPKNVLPSGMIPRYKPFGCDGVRLPRKRRHGSASEAVDAEAKLKKKKKKHHHRHHHHHKLGDSQAAFGSGVGLVGDDHVAAQNGEVRDFQGAEEEMSRKKKKKSKKNKR